ncbi:MAG: ABC transporter permease, partial [Prevotella sp.]|nr:ABC transporter permease [Prevotella sp.]
MLNHIVNAFKNLPRRGQHNFVKILCLALGLAISSVIIAEIYFEQTYDTYFPGWERTYQIMEVGHNKGEKLYFDQTSGATAHGIAQYAPIVEAATRVNWLKSNAQCKLENQQVFSADMVLADSCFFDVFPQRIFMGNAKETLSRPKYCLVSSRV